MWCFGRYKYAELINGSCLFLSGLIQLSTTFGQCQCGNLLINCKISNEVWHNFSHNRNTRYVWPTSMCISDIAQDIKKQRLIISTFCTSSVGDTTNLRYVLRVTRLIQESQPGESALDPDGKSLMSEQDIVQRKEILLHPHPRFYGHIWLCIHSALEWDKR